MKRLIVLFFVVMSGNLFSQNKTNADSLSTKIQFIWGQYYLYNTKALKEKEIFQLMNKTNDNEIMNLIRQSTNAKHLKALGYIAIPALIGGLIFEEYSISQVYNRNGTTDNKKKNKYNAEAYTCFAITVACPVVSIIMKHKYKKTRTEAVKLYNQKY